MVQSLALRNRIQTHSRLERFSKFCLSSWLKAHLHFWWRQPPQHIFTCQLPAQSRTTIYMIKLSMMRHMTAHKSARVKQIYKYILLISAYLYNIHTCIYKWRNGQRGSTSKGVWFIYIYIVMYTSILHVSYIHIYIYIKREREREEERETCGASTWQDIYIYIYRHICIPGDCIHIYIYSEKHKKNSWQ